MAADPDDITAAQTTIDAATKLYHEALADARDKLASAQQAYVKARESAMQAFKEALIAAAKARRGQ